MARAKKNGPKENRAKGRIFRVYGAGHASVEGYQGALMMAASATSLPIAPGYQLSLHLVFCCGSQTALADHDHLAETLLAASELAAPSGDMLGDNFYRELVSRGVLTPGEYKALDLHNKHILRNQELDPHIQVVYSIWPMLAADHTVPGTCPPSTSSASVTSEPLVRGRSRYLGCRPYATSRSRRTPLHSTALGPLGQTQIWQLV